MTTPRALRRPSRRLAAAQPSGFHVQALLLWRRRQILPGFGLTLGFTLFYLSVIVLLPLSAAFAKASGLGLQAFVAAVANPRVVASYAVSLRASAAAAAVNTVLGTIVAWVLVRYRFPGKGFLDAMVDLPFALPTSVAGISLAAIYGPKGWLGAALLQLGGWRVAYTETGIFVALTFIGLPFVVRTLQPVLAELNPEFEEAAACLGASRWQTMARVVFPELLPPAVTGFALAFARALGEYGSVVFIAGNMPMRTEIVPLLIITKLEQYDFRGATAVATVMLTLSFSLLLIINLLQRWSSRWLQR